MVPQGPSHGRWAGQMVGMQKTWDPRGWVEQMVGREGTNLWCWMDEGAREDNKLQQDLLVYVGTKHFQDDAEHS